MNHSCKRRGEVKSAEETAKEEALAAQVNAAWDQFIKARKDWRQTTKSIDELLEYSAKVLAIMSDTSSTINFRQDLINEKLTQIVVALKEAAKKDAIAKAEKESAKTEQPNPEDDKACEDKAEVVEQDQKPEISEKDKVMEDLKNLIKKEMEMLVGLAMKDPKSYQLWHHRKWMFIKIWELETQLHAQGKISKPCVAMDIKICDKFLMKDERNFHAWNYRCFLINYLLERFPDEALQVLNKELDFLQAKLDSNFSNYSAIHFKTKYLVRRHALSAGDRLSADDNYTTLDMKVISAEVEFVKQGLFIAPYEQSLWIYIGWLVDRKVIVSCSVSSVDDIALHIQANCDDALLASIVDDVCAVDQTGDELKVTLNDGKLVVARNKSGDSSEITLCRRDNAIGSFLMPKTSIRIDEEGKATLIHQADANTDAKIGSMIDLWRDVFATVKEIAEVETTNKEVYINLADLWCKYSHQTKSLSTHDCSIQGIKSETIAEGLTNIRSSTTNHALIDYAIDSLHTIEH